MTIWQFWVGKPMPAVVRLCRATIAARYSNVRLVDKDAVCELGGNMIFDLNLNPTHTSDLVRLFLLEIGRASCRERV